MPIPPERDPLAASDPEPIPRGQRIFDNVHLLLVLGIAIVFLLYTGWGLWEILSMPPATLP